jgi:hypothetical protein
MLSKFEVMRASVAAMVASSGPTAQEPSASQPRARGSFQPGATVPRELSRDQKRLIFFADFATEYLNNSASDRTEPGRSAAKLKQAS